MIVYMYFMNSLYIIRHIWQDSYPHLHVMEYSTHFGYSELSQFTFGAHVKHMLFYFDFLPVNILRDFPRATALLRTMLVMLSFVGIPEEGLDESLGHGSDLIRLIIFSP